jgi:predicted membrane metal-binding protein
MDEDRGSSQQRDTVRPDYAAFDGLFEHRQWSISSLLQVLGNRPLPDTLPILIAVLLFLLAGRFIEASERLTTINLIAGLAIAGMLCGLGVLAVFVGNRRDAKIGKTRPNDATEPGNARGSPSETRGTPRGNGGGQPD